MAVGGRVKRSSAMAVGLATTVVEPLGSTNGRVLYCLPGGGMSRGYFDLQADGYSMAAHLADLGFISVLIDHPAVGDSPVPADAWSLTPHVVADADAAAVQEMHRRLGGIPIGVGHSMGAMLTVTLQARHRPYAALGLLGFAQIQAYSETALAAHLTAEERLLLGNSQAIENQLVPLAKARFGRSLPRGSTVRSPFLYDGMEVGEVAFEAIDACASNLLAVCGLGSMLKCAAPEMSQIDVPVFLGFGERDITGPARDTANALPHSRDITLYELPGAGHNQNVVGNRTWLWNRLSTWALSVDFDWWTRPTPPAGNVNSDKHDAPSPK